MEIRLPIHNADCACFRSKFANEEFSLAISHCFFKIIISSCSSQSTESTSSTLASVVTNNTLTSTSSSSSMSSSTTRHKYVPSVTPNPKVKKRGSSSHSSESPKVKKNAHAGNVQNVNSSREALNQEGSDQQVSNYKEVYDTLLHGDVLNLFDSTPLRFYRCKDI
jgi:hypothetical protein